MKQVLQNLKSGVIELADVPCPKAGAGHVLIRSRASLISAGTERMVVEFAQSSLIAKARSQPDKVKQVLDKIRTDGLLPTLEAVFAKLDEPLPLGYCNAGVVEEVGAGVSEFSIGDRVISNGAHAEFVCVSRLLCAKIPDGVGDEEAAFGVLGSIGLQGIRLLAPTLGERVVVVGLGLIGLMSVQILSAHGCQVLGIDPDPSRCGLARGFGAQTVDLSASVDPVAATNAFSGGIGVDGVLITASSKDSGIIKQAAAMCRKRGRIVLVGVVGMELDRSDFYRKELSFQVSCSYGPGRYDPAYEERGEDYPLPYVRWTQQRNFEAVLQLMASGRLDVEKLISRQVPIEQAASAYQTLAQNRDALGLVLTYPGTQAQPTRVIELSSTTVSGAGTVVVGMIGAGNFAKRTLLPAMRGLSIRLRMIASAGGVTARHLGNKFGFEQVATDVQHVLSDPAINLVMILTRHDAHAKLVISALEAGKHVFVEKPLCLDEEELQRISAAHQAARDRQLIVGFNRRFSPHAMKICQLLAGRSQPVCMNMMVNPGVVQAGSWLQDAHIGGGRIIGEACHWIDLLSFLVSARVTRVSAAMVGGKLAGPDAEDKMSITLSLADGSIGTIHYFGNGHRAYPKETLEVFSEGRTLRLDNFRTLRGWGWPGFSNLSLWRQDKGHTREMRRMVASISGGEPIMRFEEIANVTRASFAAVESARNGRPVEVIF